MKNKRIIIINLDLQFKFIVSGAFRVEMQRESQKDRTILCKYEPTEPGDYRIEVKWSGEHVPGSPFMVMIFDTQEELSRFLQVR
jgi:filamin